MPAAPAPADPMKARRDVLRPAPSSSSRPGLVGVLVTVHSPFPLGFRPGALLRFLRGSDVCPALRGAGPWSKRSGRDPAPAQTTFTFAGAKPQANRPSQGSNFRAYRRRSVTPLGSWESPWRSGSAMPESRQVSTRRPKPSPKVAQAPRHASARGFQTIFGGCEEWWRLLAQVLRAGQRAGRASASGTVSSGRQPSGARCSSGWNCALYAILALRAIQ